MQAKTIAVGRSLLLAAVTGLGMTLSAADTVFVGEDDSGSGDLANKDHWAGGALPGATGAIAFDRTGTVDASSAVQFGAAKVTAASGELIFCTANPVTLTSFENTAGSAKVSVKGGTTMSVSDVVSVSATEGAVGATLVVDGSGTQLSQTANSANKGVFTGLGVSNVIEVTSGATLGVSRQLIVGGKPSSAAKNHSHRLLIGANSTVNTKSTSGGWSEVVVVGDFSPSNRVDVHGTWTAPSGYHQMLIGKSSGYNKVEVFDGGSLTGVGKWFVGYGGAFNELVARSGSTVRQTDGSKDRVLTVGHGANASNNVLRIKSGATFGSAAPIHVGVSGSCNLADIEDPIGFGVYFLGDNAGSTGNLCRLHGTTGIQGDLNAVYFGAGTGNVFLMEGIAYTNIGNQAVKGTGRGNKMVFKDMSFRTQLSVNPWGADDSTYEFDNVNWSHYIQGSQHRIYWSGSNETIRLLNGTTADFTGPFYMGATRATYGGNRLEVRDGSSVSFSNLSVEGSGNEIVVSNGTLTIASNFQIPQKSNVTCPKAATNTVLRFEGDSPRFVSKVAANFATATAQPEEGEPYVNVGHTHLVFALPVGGYQAVPFSAPSVAFPATTRIKIELPAGARNYSGKYVLAEATGTGKNDVITVADLAELGSELSERCSLKLSGDKKQLVLKFKTGLMLQMR